MANQRPLVTKAGETQQIQEADTAYLDASTSMDQPTFGSELLSESGWTSTGWTGGWAAGWKHTTGNTFVLSNTLAPSVGVRYHVSIIVSEMTAGRVDVSFGGLTATAISPLAEGNGEYGLGIVAQTTANLTAVPQSAFDGKIVFSVKEVTTASPSKLTMADSADQDAFQFRVRPAAKDNFLIGNNAGQYITSGDNNFLLGTNAGEQLMSGFDNIFIGTDAGKSMSAGRSNLLIGARAGQSMTGGASTSQGNPASNTNIAVGTAALENMVSGSQNTVFGRSAGVNTTTAFDNVFVGYFAAEDITTGTHNLFIGFEAGSVAGSVPGVQKVDPTNSIAIGTRAFTTADNQAMLGNNSITQTILRGTVDIVRSTNPCRLNVYNTSDDEPIGANTEMVSMRWSGNLAIVGTQVTGTGVVRDVIFARDYPTAGANRLHLTSESGQLVTVFNMEAGDVDFRVEGDTATHLIFVDANAATENVALVSTGLPNWQSMDRGIYIQDRAAAPGGNPSGGAFLYSDSGALVTLTAGGVSTPLNFGTITSGVYTPTRSAETNLDANVTPSQAQFMRVGNVVTVSGRVSTNPTTTLTLTSFELTLPVASNIGAVADLAGTAVAGAVASMSESAMILGSVANDTAVFQWTPVDVGSQVFSYTYTYRII